MIQTEYNTWFKTPKLKSYFEQGFKQVKQTRMEQLLRDISVDYNIPLADLLQKYGDRLDDDTTQRCSANNKNGKQCSKLRKDGSNFCSIHSNTDKQTDDFVASDSIVKKAKEKEERSSSKKEKESSTLLILETEQKEDCFPIKVKKIHCEGKFYYINRHNIVFNMNPETEMIITPPIGQFAEGTIKLFQIAN
jgi:hypothetical protein